MLLSSLLLLSYVHNCAPRIASNTMLAIIKTESNGNPWAINLNRKVHLLYQPHSQQQAVHWLNYLEAHRYDFDVGLAQVNIRNIRRYGYKAQDLLDPCINLMVASDILRRNYHQAVVAHSQFYSREHWRNNRNIKVLLDDSGNKWIYGVNEEQLALYEALSAYNSGNFYNGLRNGYVVKVVNNAKIIQQ